MSWIQDLTPLARYNIKAGTGLVTIPIVFLCYQVISTDYFLLYGFICVLVLDLLIFPGQYNTLSIPKDPKRARIIAFFFWGSLALLAFIFGW